MHMADVLLSPTVATTMYAASTCVGALKKTILVKYIDLVLGNKRK